MTSEGILGYWHSQEECHNERKDSKGDHIGKGVKVGAAWLLLGVRHTGPGLGPVSPTPKLARARFKARGLRPACGEHCPLSYRTLSFTGSGG
jgi:hypothetical protein